MERFDRFSAGPDNASATPEEPPTPPAANGHSIRDSPTKHAAEPASVKTKSMPPSSPTSTPPKREIDDDAAEPLDVSPPKKKRKADSVDPDAAYAARLQAQENLLARPTRGGNSRKVAPVKKKKSPSKKATTAKKVRASDDSDIDSSEVGEKEVNRNTGFHVSSPRTRIIIVF